MKFADLKLRNRLFIGFGLIIIAISIVEINTLSELDNLSNISRNLINHPLKVSNAIRDIKININQMHGYVKDITQTETTTELNDIIKLLDVLEKRTCSKFDTVKKYFLGDIKDVESTYQAFKDWKTIRDEFIRLKSEGKTKEALAIERGKGDEQIAVVMYQADKMIEFANKKAGEFLRKSVATRDLVYKKVLWLSITIIVFAIIITIFITGSITKPIEKIIQRIKNISKDQFDVEISAAGVHSLTVLEKTVDELEDLSRKLAQEAMRREQAQQELDEYQKHLEEIVSSRTKELHETKQLLSNAFDGAAIGMVLVNPEGKFFWTNAAFCETIGYTDSELKNLSFNDITHPEDHQIGSEVVKKIIAGEAHKGELIKRYINKNGNVIYVKLTTSLIKNEDETPSHFFTQIQDITVQKLAEEKLKEYSTNLEEMVKERTSEIEIKSRNIQESQKALTFLLEDVNESRAELEIANKKMELANKELESFSYSVSHDLRAPLRAIDGFSRMLMDNYADNLDEEGKRLFDTIRTNTKKMGQLIDDLLAFSRLGRKKIDRSKINMNELATEIIDELKVLEPTRELEISVDEFPPVFGDKSLIRQAIFNLLSNAAKFTNTKSKAIIRFGFEEKDEYYTYYVEDNGVGFKMQYADKLFKVFQRLHSEQEFEGTGVGLAIVHKIVTKHGGQIWAEAELNKGAKFYFTLPKQENDYGS